MIDAIVLALLATGVFFFAVGTLGLIRMPDAFCRIHATTKCDTLGSGLVLVALALHSRSPQIAAKLMLILIFMWLTNPVSSHLLGRAIYRTRFLAKPDTRSDSGPGGQQ